MGGITEATEGLRVKFEKIRIAEGPSLRVNMVDLKQPSPEMEEVERCLKLEREQMSFGYPKANETLREYLWRCHRRNSEMLVCPRCDIVLNQRVAEAYERA